MASCTAIVFRSFWFISPVNHSYSSFWLPCFHPWYSFSYPLNVHVFQTNMCMMLKFYFQRWGVSKFAESYLRWKLPLKKHGLIPKRSFLQDISSCQVGFLPKNFYDKVEGGSIVLKKSQSFSFCKEGLIINEEPQPLKADLVILATGYKGDQKLKQMFKSQIFQKYIVGSASSIVPLYRFVSLLKLG